MNWLRNSLFVFGAIIICLILAGALSAGLLLIKTILGIVAAGVCTVFMLAVISAFIGYMITKGFEQ